MLRNHSSPGTTPDFETFRTSFDAGTPLVVCRNVLSDLLTPVSAYLRLAARDKNTFLLESVEGGERLGRFSIIGIRPDTVWRCTGGRSEINTGAATGSNEFTPQSGNPLDNLKTLLAESAIPGPGKETGHQLPPMAAGIFGYLGYDMARQMERLPSPPPGEPQTPDALFIRPSVVAVFDNIRQIITLCTAVRPADGKGPARAAYADACERLEAAVNSLCTPVPVRNHAAGMHTHPVTVRSCTTREQYHDMVVQAKRYIEAGDIFQVVLSQNFSCSFDRPPFDLYRALRRKNPSPFLFFLDFDDFSLAGSSPEILVRIRNGQITIRPIAGTRPRGKTPEQDLAFETALLADPKERAEHLMLLDLGRNDTGRSARPGSVRVTENFVIERYSHVMHIVSNVVGDLREDVHPVDAVAAGFPAGTVSGAPKIRAMEIIDRLEKTARGVYGGAIGYFSATGAVDTCIALRTALVKDGTMHVRAGAGIVADSVPGSEYRECVNKAQALFSAAGEALALPEE